MIIEENINGWNNNPVKTDEVIYSQAKDEKAPKILFSASFAVLVVPEKVIYSLSY